MKVVLLFALLLKKEKKIESWTNFCPTFGCQKYYYVYTIIEEKENEKFNFSLIFFLNSQKY